MYLKLVGLEVPDSTLEDVDEYGRPKMLNFMSLYVLSDAGDYYRIENPHPLFDENELFDGYSMWVTPTTELIATNTESVTPI